MPTGAGKSVCYQIPAIMAKGVTIVISPLISLMKDQVDALTEMGINSTFINSTLTPKEFGTIMSNARMGMYKLIYVAPERLETESFMELISSINIDIVAIDEAHCVSQWGHDFRVSYQRIADMIEKIKKRPVVVAFTATATLTVKEDIINLLKLKEQFSITTGFDRKNLDFKVIKPNDKYTYLTEYLKNKKDDSGIIYCSTRKTVESICEKLNKQGILATRYHGGLSEKERNKNQEDFIYEKVSIIVATNAFGMGIDKSNIRFVVHYNMPKNIESYYQEAGRSGRDGEKAECVLLFNGSDIITNKFLIEQGNENIDKSNEYQKLNDMVNYCNTTECLREYILQYFGDKTKIENCHNCSNCNNEFEITNITTEAQKIMSCIKRIGERFGSSMVVDVLRGSRSAKIKSLGFDTLSTYGIMSEYSKESIKRIISFLVAEQYLSLVGDKYPILSLNRKSMLILNGEEQIEIRIELESKDNKIQENSNIDFKLFEILRQLRKEIAIEQNVPPFIIFGDVSLNDMCRLYPNTEEKMLEITGVGKFKYEKYGERFVIEIQKYIDDNNIEIEKFDKPDGSIINTPKKAKKEDTNLLTYELFKQGKTISEIAKARSMAVQTIETHLLNCWQRGLEIEIEQFVNIQYKEEIIKAIKDVGVEKLNPIKNILPKEVTYFDIKYYILLEDFNSKNDNSSDY